MASKFDQMAGHVYAPGFGPAAVREAENIAQTSDAPIVAVLAIVALFVSLHIIWLAFRRYQTVSDSMSKIRAMMMADNRRRAIEELDRIKEFEKRGPAIPAPRRSLKLVANDSMRETDAA